MKQKIGLLIVITLVCLFIGNIVKGKLEENKQIDSAALGYEVDLASQSMLKQGDLAPDITFTTLDGEEAKLSDYRGKKVVLNFWATWCPPCKAEMPHMQTYYEKQAKEENVEIIGFNMTFSSDSPEKIASFVSSYDLTFPIYLTYDQNVTDQYQIFSMPTTFFIDEEGRIQQKIIGPLNQETLAQYVKNLD